MVEPIPNGTINMMAPEDGVPRIEELNLGVPIGNRLPRLDIDLEDFRSRWRDLRFRCTSRIHEVK